MIYTFAGNAIDEQRQEEHADDETFWMPTAEEWTPIYTAAAEKVETALGLPQLESMKLDRRQDKRRNAYFDRRRERGASNR